VTSFIAGIATVTTLPRTKDGHDVAEDEEGMELSSMRQVQEEAARSLADMIRGASADMWALRLFLQNKGLPIVRSEFARS